MLKPKKIDTKKVITYFIVIFIMFGGSVFFLYKNYKLTVGSKLEESRDLFEKEEYGRLNIIDDSGEEFNIKNKDSKTLDVDIFSDPKYNNLKNNTPSKTSIITIGKKNPFEVKQ